MPKDNELRTSLGFIAALLISSALTFSCASGDFFMPSDVSQEDPVPERFLKELLDGWTWLGIAPDNRLGSRVEYVSLRWIPEFVNVGRRGPTAGVIAADSRHLWIVPRPKFLSMSTGLVQIDLSTMTGTRFNDLNVSLPSNRVNSVRARGDGTAWIATYSGAMNFDPETWFGTTFDDWYTFDQEGGGLQRNYILFTTTPSVFDILERRGRILFLTGDMYVFNQERVRWTRYQRAVHGHPVNSYEHRFVRKEKVWDKKKEKYRTYKVKVEVEVFEYSMRPDRDGGLLDDTVFAGAVSPDRAFLLSHHGITEVDFRERRFRHHVRSHSDATLDVECRKTDEKLDVCVHERWEVKQRHWPETASLIDVMATSCVIDEQGAAWFGFGGMTSGRNLERGRSGIMRYHEGRWQNVRDPLLRDRRVTDLAFAGGDMYAGTTNGLIRSHLGSWREVHIPGGPSHMPVLDLEYAAGRLWVATPHGIYFKVLDDLEATVSPAESPLPLPGSRRIQ